MSGALRLTLQAGKRSAVVTPDDEVELSPMRQLWVGTGGTMVFRLRDDTEDRTLANIPDGTVLNWDFKLIKATGSSGIDDLLAIR